MSLPDRFNKRVRQAIGANAVWLPGTPIALGSVLVKGEGRFRPFSDLSSFGVQTDSLPHLDRNLSLASTGTRQTLIQGGAEVKEQALDLTAEAKLKIEFTRSFEYTMKSETLKGQTIKDLAKVASVVSKHADWKHDKYYIVYELYVAGQFSFIGTEKSGSTIELSGKGSDVQSFLSVGASVGLKKTGTADVTIIGQGGPVAMGLVRIKKNGDTDFV